MSLKKKDKLLHFIEERNNLFLIKFGYEPSDRLPTFDTTKVVPNTLRYLDKQSQTLIKTVNAQARNLSLSDKVLTAIMYRLVCNLDVITSLSENLAFLEKNLLHVKRFITYRENFDQGLQTPLTMVSSTDRGTVLMHLVDLLYKRVDWVSLQGKTLAEVMRAIDEADKDYTLPSYLYLQVALDVAYIDDMSIVIDNHLGYDTHNRFNNVMRGLDLVGWYKDLWGDNPHLKYITVQDTLHMWYGWLGTEYDLHKRKCSNSKPSHLLNNLQRKDAGSLVVPASIINYD